jgi:hypothetical protein
MAKRKSSKTDKMERDPDLAGEYWTDALESAKACKTMLTLENVAKAAWHEELEGNLAFKSSIIARHLHKCTIK